MAYFRSLPGVLPSARVHIFGDTCCPVLLRYNREVYRIRIFRLCFASICAPVVNLDSPGCTLNWDYSKTGFWTQAIRLYRPTIWHICLRRSWQAAPLTTRNARTQRPLCPPQRLKVQILGVGECQRITENTVWDAYLPVSLDLSISLRIDNTLIPVINLLILKCCHFHIV